MKKCFIQFDFWDRDITESFHGLLYLDLYAEIDLDDICRELIQEHFPTVNAYDVKIKVNSFNAIQA